MVTMKKDFQKEIEKKELEITAVKEEKLIEKNR